MAHEITRTDNVVLHKDAAWHGLGTIIQDAASPTQALEIGGLDWTVEKWSLAARKMNSDATAGYDEIDLKHDYANIRSDTHQLLGIVGKDYRPIQNLELAQFCEALAEQGDEVKIETAGSIRGGKKVWFLLKGESFTVRKEDEVNPYILVSNGHDGGTALRCTPTTVRVVCSNTLHMVIPSKFESEGRAKLGQSCYVAHHTATIMQRVEEAKAALGLYNKSLVKTREVIDALAAKEVDNATVKRFFLECFVRDFGSIPAVATTAKEERKKLAAMEAVREMTRRFETESPIAGTTLWNMTNAVTGWGQHRKSRMKDAAKSQERKVESKLFGVDADRGFQTLTAALALAT